MSRQECYPDPGKECVWHKSGKLFRARPTHLLVYYTHRVRVTMSVLGRSDSMAMLKSGKR